MKRNLPSPYPSFIVKTIPNTSASRSKEGGNLQEKCSYDVGNAYITVPVYKMNEKFTKKQIKEAPSMYNVHSTSNNSFILSLKSESSVHMAVPYYRPIEALVNGKSYISVTNFYPASTIQSTPPLGVNVIGQTAHLIMVDNKSLKSVFVCPKDSSGSVKILGAGNVNPILNGKIAPMLSITPKPQPIQPVASNPEQYSATKAQLGQNTKNMKPINHRGVKNGDSLNDGKGLKSEKRQRQIGTKATNPPKASRIESDKLITRNKNYTEMILNYLAKNGMLKYRDITVLYRGEEEEVIKASNTLVALNVIKFYSPNTTIHEGVYVLNVSSTNEVALDLNNRGRKEEQIKDELEIQELQKRLMLLEKYAREKDVSLSAIMENIQRIDPSCNHIPLYQRLLDYPQIKPKPLNT